MTNRVIVDLKKLKRFRKVVDVDLRRKGNGPIRKALKQWAYRYRSFARRRWLAQSKGGGDWPVLKPQTIARRRKKSDKILIDTATMLGGFTPEFGNKPGQIEEDISFGIRVGLGGSSPHPRGGVTLGDLYRIHHFGQGRVPARPLVVQPDAATVRGMRSDMKRAMKEAAEGG